MADIKMNFNGDVSIEKMFDIHDNQQVAIYNNNNTENKEKQNNPLKDISEENFNIPSNVFCVTELHRTYWKEFCDVHSKMIFLICYLLDYQQVHDNANVSIILLGDKKEPTK